MKTSETNLEINSTKHFNVDAFIDSWDGSEEALEKLSEEEWKLFWEKEVEEVNKQIDALSHKDFESMMDEIRDYQGEVIFVKDIKTSHDNEYQASEILAAMKRLGFNLSIDEEVMCLSWSKREINKFDTNRVKFLFRKYADKVWDAIKVKLEHRNATNKKQVEKLGLLEIF